jgi:hypothetical protein
MTSKQRVDKIFRGEIPDRTPIGFFAIDSDIASKVLGRETYWRAKAKSQIAFWEGRREEVVQSWIEDGIELYKKLDIIDIIPAWNVAAGICPPKNYIPEVPRKIDDDTWKDENGRIYKYSPISRDISIIKDNSICLGANLECEVWDGRMSIPDESIFQVVDAFLNEFGRTKFVLGSHAGEFAWFLSNNMEIGLMELALRPGEIKHIYDSKVASANAHDKLYVRPEQSGVLWGTDLSTQRGPMLNPEIYKKIFLDGYKTRINSIKSLNQRVVKHMCGNNWAILDLMVEAGIDCYQSIQESAGMDIIQLYKQYSDKIVLWGGVCLENLMHGSMDDVRKDVKKVMTELASKGRFILGTSHSVAIGTKYDNFMAMLDEASKYI